MQDPVVSDIVCVTNNKQQLEHGIYMGNNLVSIPSYKGDYAVLNVAMGIEQGNNHNDTLSKLIIVSQFQPWWFKKHAELWNYIVLECLCSRRNSLMR